MKKEEMTRIGKELKQAAPIQQQVKKRMDKHVNTNGVVSSRDTVDGIIQCCLLGNIECQKLIDILNSDDSTRKQAINYLLAAYIGA